MVGFYSVKLKKIIFTNLFEYSGKKNFEMKKIIF